MPGPGLSYDAGGGAPGGGFLAIVIRPDHSADGAAAEAAIRALGGNVSARVRPEDAVTRLDEQHATAMVVIADVAELPSDAAADLVTAVAALCAARAWPLLVAIARAQIDVTAASLFAGASNTQLLCEASAADWVAAVAAVAVAAGKHGGEGLVRESEAARLARLNEEVARIAEVLARLSGRDAAAVPGGGERREDFDQGAPATAITAQDVRDVIRARRLRERYFPGGLLEDPAWDILLDLFAAELERGQVSVSSLCIAAAVAPTTALRWIGKLTDIGLLARASDPFDKRRVFVTLTATARNGMLRYLAALQEFGLRMA